MPRVCALKRRISGFCVASHGAGGVGALRVMVQQQAAAEREDHGDRVVGDFGRAVIRDVADEDVAGGGGFAVEPVVADPHAHDGAQAGEAGDVGGAQELAEDHQALDLGAFGVGEVGDHVGVAHEDADVRAEDRPLLRVVGVHAFGVHDGDHRRTFSPFGWLLGRAAA